MSPKQICLLLDHQARSDLRQACQKGYINRSHSKKRGVNLLVGTGLVERTKTLKTMYRYEPTDLGHSVAKYLPSSDAEWQHVMNKDELVYGDGFAVAYSDTPRYIYVRDYNKAIQSVKRNSFDNENPN